MKVRADATAAPAAQSTLAALEISGSVLRYGEVIRGGGQTELRRLGTCEFEFDAADAAFGDVEPQNFDTFVDAATEILGDAHASTLRVAVHPSDLTGFFSPLPDGLAPAERHELLRQEAALLADATPTQPIRIQATPVRTEEVVLADAPEPRRWHHVFHIPEPVHARMTLLTRALGIQGYDIVDCTRAAAIAVAASEERPAEPELQTATDTAFTLVLGAYVQHVELGIVQNGEWFHGHHGPADAPEDAAYFALAMLDAVGLGPADVERLLLYGENAMPERFSLLADLLDLKPTLFNPLAVFGQTPPGATPEQLASFVPCIGALLA